MQSSSDFDRDNNFIDISSSSSSALVITKDKKKDKKEKRKKSSTSSQNRNVKENKKRKKEEVSTHWTSSNVFILLSIVRDFVVNGNLHTDSGFKNADWKHFENEFHKQTGLAYSRQSMQSKLSELKRKFVQLNTIKSTSGVGWDGESCLPVATPAFIKAFCAGTRKKYNVMFTKKLDNYDILYEIFKGKVSILATYFVFSCIFFKVIHFSLSMRQDPWLVLPIRLTTRNATAVAAVVAHQLVVVVTVMLLGILTKMLLVLLKERTIVIGRILLFLVCWMIKLLFLAREK